MPATELSLPHHGAHDAGSTVNCKNLPWLPLAPKIWIKLVKLQPETGVHTVIIRAEPGGILPPHRHIEAAEIFVLKGSGAHPQTGHFAEGDFVSESKGAVHDPLVFEVETEMLMTSQGPSVFLDEQGNDLYTMDVPMLQGLAQSVVR